MPMTPEQRFLKKVIIPKDLGHDCWEWTGSKMPFGHGQIRINYKLWLAHRYSYLMFNGYLHAGSVVRHTCDNPGCVNPNHLRQGSQKDNLRDMFSKKRNWQAKVTHCPKGHKYTDENTSVKKNSRFCRACWCKKNAYI